MAQLNDRYQLVRMGTFGATWNPITSPISDCRTLTVINTDATHTLDICTDSADANAVLTIAAGASYPIALQRLRTHGFTSAMVCLYARGSGTAPLLAFAA